MSVEDEVVLADIEAAGRLLTDSIARDSRFASCDLQDALDAARFSSHLYSTPPKEVASLVFPGLWVLPSRPRACIATQLVVAHCFVFQFDCFFRVSKSSPTQSTGNIDSSKYSVAIEAVNDGKLHIVKPNSGSMGALSIPERSCLSHAALIVGIDSRLPWI